MTVVRPQEHSYQDAIVSGVGAVNTVSSGPDNGANNNLACGLWNSMRHSTTQQAIQNFFSRMSTTIPKSSDSDLEILAKGVGQLNICGHGTDGQFSTGCGQNGQIDYQRNIMATWNENSWGFELQKLKGQNFTILTFWSCHTGAGQEGADFLYAVANRIGLPARANTGWLYSNSRCRIWRENGAQWQVATPGSRPPPIDAPSPHAILAHDKAVPFEGTDMINPEESTKLSLLRRDMLDRDRHDEIEIPEDVQRQIIDEIARSVQIELPGQTLGYLTHTIQIEQASGERLEFGIMNRRMIVNRGEELGIAIPPSLRGFVS